MTTTTTKTPTTTITLARPDPDAFVVVVLWRRGTDLIVTAADTPAETLRHLRAALDVVQSEQSEGEN